MTQICGAATASLIKSKDSLTNLFFSIKAVQRGKPAIKKNTDKEKLVESEYSFYNFTLKKKSSPAATLIEFKGFGFPLIQYCLISFPITQSLTGAIGQQEQTRFSKRSPTQTGLRWFWFFQSELRCVCNMKTFSFPVPLM